jgi:hypothetical protein
MAGSTATGRSNSHGIRDVGRSLIQSDIICFICYREGGDSTIVQSVIAAMGVVGDG